MPQGKLKVKANIPVGAKVKQRTISKAKDLQKKNRPALPRKDQHQLRDSITKAINETNETTAREKAVMDGKTLRVLPSDDVIPAASSSSSAKSKGGPKKQKK